MSCEASCNKEFAFAVTYFLHFIIPLFAKMSILMYESEQQKKISMKNTKEIHYSIR